MFAHGVSAAGEPVEMTVSSPPMVSDDTGTPGPNRWEVNLVFDADFSHGSSAGEAPLFDFNYGVGDRLQLKYEVPLLFERQSEAGGDRTVRAFGNSNIGLKYRFYGGGDDALTLAIFPQISFSIGDDSNLTRNNPTTYVLPLLLVREFERASITANVGVNKAIDRAADYFASFGAGTRISERVAIMGEIAGEDLRVGAEHRILFNLGLRAKLSEKAALVASCGRDVDVGSDLQRETHVTVAYQRVFGD
jgi:hypothetical protein